MTFHINNFGAVPNVHLILLYMVLDSIASSFLSFFSFFSSFYLKRFVWEINFYKQAMQSESLAAWSFDRLVNVSNNYPNE
jgi:hypothetical protein